MAGIGISPLLRTFFLLTPETYEFRFRIFQWFPLLTSAQWLVNYRPAGKTSLPKSRFNLPGPLGWCLMEVIGPVHLLLTLYFSSPSSSEIPLWNKMVAGLYVIHYFNRSIVNPLFVAPSISPIHLRDMFLPACLFNWLNASCLAGWLLGYENNVALTTPPNNEVQSGLAVAWGILPYLGLALFTIGMVNNIRSERTLWRLRCEEADRRALAAAAAAKKDGAQDTKEKDGKKNPYSKVYVIPPPQGLFRWVLYPHYFYEWLEWSGFVLVGMGVFPSTVSYSSSNLAPWLVPFVKLAESLHVPLPLSALVFLLNDIATMLPQARRGKDWYIEKFGHDAVAGRAAVVPGISFL